MHGQRMLKSLRFVVQKWVTPWQSWKDSGWLRDRGFPRREQAERYIEKHPGEQFKIRDLREGERHAD